MDSQASPTGGPEGPSEEELRAAYEAEIKKIRVEQIVLEQVVTLVNLGMRRTGLSPGTEDERDLGQVQLAIESVRALLPLVEQVAAPQAGRSATPCPSCRWPSSGWAVGRGCRAAGAGPGPAGAAGGGRRPAGPSRRVPRPPALAALRPQAGPPSPAARRWRAGAAQRPALGSRPVAPGAADGVSVRANR